MFKKIWKRGKNIIDLEEAKVLFIESLGENPELAEKGDSYAVFDEATIEKTYGWVLFYNSRLYLETGEFRHCLAGNPVGGIVNKHDSSIHYLYGPGDIDEQIAGYEKGLRK